MCDAKQPCSSRQKFSLPVRALFAKSGSAISPIEEISSTLSLPPLPRRSSIILHP